MAVRSRGSCSSLLDNKLMPFTSRGTSGFATDCTINLFASVSGAKKFAEVPALKPRLARVIVETAQGLGYSARSGKLISQDPGSFPALFSFTAGASMWLQLSL